jgi:elongation factor G
MLETKIRQLTINRKFIPVFMGSAYKNKGVQLALDGVLKFLPSPPEKVNYGYSLNANKV